MSSKEPGHVARLRAELDRLALSSTFWVPSSQVNLEFVFRSTPLPRARSRLLQTVLNEIPNPIQPRPLHLQNLPLELRLSIANHLIEGDGHIGLDEDQVECLDDDQIQSRSGPITFQVAGGRFLAIGLFHACKTLRVDAEEIMKGYTLDIHLLVRESVLECVVIGNQARCNSQGSRRSWAADFLRQCATSTSMVVHPRAFQVTIHNDLEEPTDEYMDNARERLSYGLKQALHCFGAELGLYTPNKRITIKYQASTPEPSDVSPEYRLQTCRDSMAFFRLIRCRQVTFDHRLPWYKSNDPLLLMKAEMESQTPIKDCMAVLRDIRKCLRTNFMGWSIGIPCTMQKAIPEAYSRNDYDKLQSIHQQLCDKAQDPEILRVKDLLQRTRANINSRGVDETTAKALLGTGGRTKGINHFHFRWWEYNSDGTRKSDWVRRAMEQFGFPTHVTGIM